MVHKKYTYKDGKRYGPYLYETKRVDGKIVTTYLGQDSENKTNRKFIGSLFVLAFILGLFFIFFMNFTFTGKVTLDIDSSYNVGELIDGQLRLNLKEGELLPTDSKIAVEYAGEIKEFLLSELVLGQETTEGKFYAEGTSIVGEGFGYGVEGLRVLYPEVEFYFRIVDSDFSDDISSGGSDSSEIVDDSEEIIVKDEDEVVVESEGENTEGSKDEGSESQGSSGEEGSSSTGGESGDFGSSGGSSEGSSSSSGDSVSEESGPSESSGGISAGITGAVISDFTNDAYYGKVRKGERFEYFIGENKDAELISESVVINGVESGSDVLDLRVSDGTLIVSTKYSIEERGFGEDYLGKNALRLNIDLGYFGFVASNSSEFKVKVYYLDENIVEVKKNLNILSDIPEVVEEINDSRVDLPVLKNDSNVDMNLTFNVNTTQYKAVLGEKVRWTTKVVLDKPSEISIHIPLTAENVSIIDIVASDEIVNAGDVLQPIDQENLETTEFVEEFVEEETIIHSDSGILTGAVTAEVGFEREFSFSSFFKRVFRFTGFVTIDSGDFDGKKIYEVEGIVKEVEIEYYTPSPSVLFEENISRGKRVKVTSPGDVHYENVLVYTNISEEFGLKDAGDLRIYWIEEEAYLQVGKVADLDENGIIDYVEWIAPHLSDQTFDIIVIINAEHLDENKNYISNIYNETRELDDIWSETIPDGHYVRVTFETNLTSDRDITIFPRGVNGFGVEGITIEVFEMNGSEMIAKFENITENKYNKIYLDGSSGKGLLSESQDTFDLKILGGGLEFDHIVDPITTLTNSGNFTGITGEVNVTINAVNVTQSFVILSRAFSATDGQVNQQYFTPFFHNETTIGFRNGGENQSTGITRWQIITDEQIYTQTGETGYSTSLSHQITLSKEVNLSKAFIIYYSRSTGTVTSGHRMEFTSQFINSTIINFTRGQGVTDANIYWQVVEWEGAIVQNMSEYLATNLTQGITFQTINPVNTSASFVIRGTRSASNAGNRYLSNVYFENETSVASYIYGSTIESYISWFVVSHPRFKVQRGHYFFGGTAQQQNIPISSVNLSRTFSHSITAPEIANAANSRWQVTNWLTNDTNLALQTVASADNKNNSWFVVEVLDAQDEEEGLNCGTLSTDNALYELSGNLNSQGTCFIVTAENITLDGMGFSVIGNGSGFGVNATQGIMNFTLRNITLSNFTISVLQHSPSGSSKSELLIINSNLTHVLIDGRSQVNLASNAGVLTFINSNATRLSAGGGSAPSCIGQTAGGHGGNITLINSSVKGTINVSGGDACPNLASTNGGNGGIINILNGNNISGSIVLLDRGLDVSEGTPGEFGILTINYSSFFEDRGTFYSTNVSKLVIENSSSGGQILWLREIREGFANLSTSTEIKFNFARVDSSFVPQLNVSANVTLYNTPGTGFSNPIILKDGIPCSLGECYNFTSLNAETVTFNVSSWSNYSLGQGISSCFNITSPGVYHVASNLNTAGTCISINSSHVSVLGNNFNITGDDGASDYGIFVNGTLSILRNISINHLNFYDFGTGAYYFNSSSSAITNLRIYSSSSTGINFESSSNSTVQNIFVNSSGGAGLLLLRSTNFTLLGINSTFNSGGLSLSASSSISLINSTLAQNTGSGLGVSHIFGASSNLVVLNSNFSGNTASGINGIANMSVENSYFAGNSANGITCNGAQDLSCSNLGIVKHSTFLANNDSGLRFSALNGMSIYNNTFRLNSYGIHLSQSVTTGSSNFNISFIFINSSKNDSIFISGAASDGNNFTNITVLNGNKSFYDLRIATAGIDRTSFTNFYLENYSFTGTGGTVSFENNLFGQIRFLSAINGSGNNLSNDIRITNNSATVLSHINVGFNRSANVTFRGIRTDFNNPIVLRDGVECLSGVCYNFTSLNAGTVVFNVSYWTNYSISDGLNEPPFVTGLTINSTLGTNRTHENLTCYGDVFDYNNNFMNITVYWFNGTTTHLVTDFNNSYANGTFFNTSLLSGNTTKHHNWSCGFRIFDGEDYSFTNSSINITILNTPPTSPVLLTPTDSSTTTDRRPTFDWSDSTDADEDTITYQLNLTFNPGVGSLCSDPSRHITGISGSTHSLASELRCFFDNGHYYNWSVRAYDSEEFSSWTNVFRINISSAIVVSLPNNSVLFGSLSQFSSNDTSDDSPRPFLIQNDGNAISNITLEATSLWVTQANPNVYYQFKIDNYTFENGSFNWGQSLVSYTNVPFSGSPILGIAYLNYSNVSDSAEIDLNVSVPPNEPSGIRNSTITFTASLAEG